MPLVTQKNEEVVFVFNKNAGIVCANSSTIIFWLSEAYNRNIEYKEIFDRIFSLDARVWVKFRFRWGCFIVCDNRYDGKTRKYYERSEQNWKQEERKDDSKKGGKKIYLPELQRRASVSVLAESNTTLGNVEDFMYVIYIV